MLKILGMLRLTPWILGWFFYFADPCLLIILWKNGWTDFHEIFMKYQGQELTRMSRRKHWHLKSSRSLTVSSASRSHSGCLLHQGILLTFVQFRSMTIGPPIPEIQFDLENSRSKAKVKNTPVSAASHWLISLVFHIRSSYRLPSLSFHDNDNRTSHSRDTIWPPIPEIQFDLENSRSKSKVKVKCTLVSIASSWLISFLFHINWTNHA